MRRAGTGSLPWCLLGCKPCCIGGNFGQVAGGAIVFLFGTSQRPLGARYPVKFALFFSWMSTSWFRNRCMVLEVKIMVQLESQACPIDNSDA